MKAVIIACGEDIDNEVLMGEIESSDCIICADGGGEIAYSRGITPDYLIGDLDSINPEILEIFKEKSVEIIKYPRDKDYTDTELCLYKALEIGCMEICIIAGVGSRIDHSLGNIGLLHLISKKGGKGYILSGKSSIYLCNDSIRLCGEVGDTISIIPFNGNAKGLKSSGLRFELNNTDIEFGKPIGISNEMTEKEFSIEIEKGEILVIKQKII